MLDANVSGTGAASILEFSDVPANDDGASFTFEWWLASVNKDGSIHGLHEGGIQWTWSNPVTPGIDPTDPQDWTVRIDQSFNGLPDPQEVASFIAPLDKRIHLAEVSTIRSAGERAYPDFPVSFTNAETKPADFHSFLLPYLTSNGQLMYSARVTTGSLSDVPFDTADSIWTTRVSKTAYSDPPAVQSQTSVVAHADIAPADGWRGAPPPHNALEPRFFGRADNRIEALGIGSDQVVLFQSGRWGVDPQKPNRLHSHRLIAKFFGRVTSLVRRSRFRAIPIPDWTWRWFQNLANLPSSIAAEINSD